jgi:hypothetical protein
LIALTGAGPPNESKIGTASTQKTKQIPSPPTPAALSENFTPYPDRESNDCYQSDDHERSDLCAQWRAALAAEKAAQAAKLSNWISSAGALLSFVSILFVVAALRQARDANRISAKEFALSRIEAKASAKHAERALEIAASALANDREIGQAQVRAYVTIFDPDLSFNGQRPAFRFRLINSGNSPAFGILVTCNFGDSLGGVPIIDRSLKSPGIRVGTLKQGDTTRIHQIDIPKDVRQPSGPQPRENLFMKIEVSISYRDVFKAKQILRTDYISVLVGTIENSRPGIVEDGEFTSLESTPPEKQSEQN